MKMTGDLSRIVEEYAAAWSAVRDVEKLVSFFAEDGVYETLAGTLVHRGKEQLRAFFQNGKDSFPDEVVQIRSVFVGGDRFAIEGIMKGTLTRQYHNFHATGKRFSVPISVIGELDVDDGKIKRVTTYFDLATFLRQVGLPPETPLKQG
jgi:steroid delta-isomerase-like uncharacterized protein